MKNIQVIDGARNCVYDIFSATEEEFALIFAEGQDIAFIDEVYLRGSDEAALNSAFKSLWTRRIVKTQAMGIHGLLFYQLDEKKKFYPTRRDEKQKTQVVHASDELRPMAGYGGNSGRSATWPNCRFRGR